jgi:hypothetical protein
MGSRVSSTPGYNDADGAYHGGSVNSYHVPIFTVRTPQYDYDIEGKSKAFSLGDQLELRIEGSRAFVLLSNGKEQKFWLVGQKIRE